MAKKIIRLTESELVNIVKRTARKMVKESVSNTEYTMDDWRRDGALNISKGMSVSEEVFDKLMGEVPPIVYGNKTEGLVGGITQVGEPCSTGRLGRRDYDAYQTFCGRTFIGNFPTVEECPDIVPFINDAAKEFCGGMVNEGITYGEAEECRRQFIQMVEDGVLEPKETLINLASFIEPQVIDDFLRANVMGPYDDVDEEE